MRDPLATYLHDHLAGARAAIDLLDSLRDRHPDQPLGRFAAELRAEVAEDRETLQRLAARAGASSNPLKDALAWLAAKASRAKLDRRIAGELGTFEALEALTLGVAGKLALWHALAALAPHDPRLDGVDFEALAARASSQHARLERARVARARAALSPAVDLTVQST